ncbi:MAG: toll/interleukin-1 receptor domain-containing protein [Oceanicaulis sp.]
MKRYRAFISYNQKDKPVVKKLHRWLETYRVPRGVPAEIELGPGRRLGRFFRDDEEMAASPDIGGTVRGAIEDAESLIIVCSPNAARSKWVDAEIQHFRKTGRERKIFAVMVAGVPNSGDPKTECFPPSLRVASDPDDPSSMPIEPLALDLRQEGRARLLARLAAGLLEVNFDTLWNRDRRRARARRDTVMSAVLGGVLALGAAGAVIVRAQNGERADQLVSAAQAQADSGANESALRLAALATQSHVLLPPAPDAEALLARAGHESLSRAAYSFDDGVVTAVAASADGRWLAAASDNVFELEASDFMLLDRRSGRVSSAMAFEGRAEALAFSPDGTRLAAARYEQFPEVYDPETGALRFELAGERYVPPQMDGHSPVPTEEIGEYAGRLVFSPDGAVIAAHPRLCAVRLLHRSNRARLVRSPSLDALAEPGPGAPPLLAHFMFLSGDRLVAAVSDTAFAVLDPATAGPVITFRRPEAETRFDLTLESIAVSPDDRLMAAAWRDGYLAVFDLGTGALVRTYSGAPQDWGPRAIAVEPGIDRLTLIGPEGEVRAWTLSTSAPLFTLPGPGARATAIHLADDRRTALAIYDAGLAQLIDLRTGLVMREHRAPLASVGYRVVAEDQAGAVFTGDDAGMVREWNARSSFAVTALPGYEPYRDHEDLRFYVNGLSFSEDGGRLMAWYGARDALLWETRGKPAPRLLEGPAAYIAHAALSPDGERALFAYGEPAGLTIRDIDGAAQGIPLADASEDWRQDVLSASFSESGDAVLVAFASLQATLFRRTSEGWMAAHSVSEPLEDNEDLYLEGNIPVTAAALSPDGTRAITASDTGLIRIWNAQTGGDIVQFRSPSSGVTAARFSPDGRTVALLHRIFSSAGDRAPLATLWTRTDGDQERWEEAHVLVSRDGGARSLVFSPDGARLVTIVDDAAVVWDVASGRRLAHEPLGVSLYRHAASVTADGRALLVALNVDFRERTGARSSVFGLEGAVLAASLERLLGPGDRDRLGLPPVLESVCDPVTGQLRGDLRRLSEEDVAAVPSLRPRLGADVCAPPELSGEMARIMDLFGGSPD